MTAGEHPEDVERIVAVLAGRGFLVSAARADCLWRRFSREWGGTWLHVPWLEIGIFNAVQPYLAADGPAEVNGSERTTAAG